MSFVYYDHLPPFERYLQPRSVEEAALSLAAHGAQARVLAGGTDLLVLMRARANAPACIVDIGRIPGLDYINGDDEGVLRIGALATLRAIEFSRTVREHYPLLHEAVHQMATVQIRNMGTMVGNTCRASPSADTAPSLLVLEAKVKIVSPHGTKRVPLDKFFLGPGRTILGPDELVTEIEVPKLPAGSGTAFLRVGRVAVDLAKANVASVIVIKHGICVDARIALGGVSSTPIRAVRTEALLSGKKLDDRLITEAGETAAAETSPVTDIRSTEQYRRDLSAVLVRRAIRISRERATRSPQA